MVNPPPAAVMVRLAEGGAASSYEGDGASGHPETDFTYFVAPYSVVDPSPRQQLIYRALRQISGGIYDCCEPHGYSAAAQESHVYLENQPWSTPRHEVPRDQA